MNRFIPFLGVAIAAVLGVHLMTRSSWRAPIKGLFIAHALGKLDGRTYLNCLECFERSYARGFRYFEMDLSETSDGYLVGLHEGFEPMYGLPKNFTLQQFRGSRVDGRFTPLDLSGVIDLLRRYPDWYLITDLKSQNRRGLPVLYSTLTAAGIDAFSRVIPQIYDRAQIEYLEVLRFERAILSLHQLTEREFREILQFTEDHPEITAVTLERSMFTRNRSELLRLNGVQTFVYTVNEEQDARSLFQEGAAAIYTDSLFDPDLAVLKDRATRNGSGHGR